MHYEVKTVSRKDPEYPEKLTFFPSAPEKLYYLGKLPDPDKKSAAIVGARSCSEYGRAQALYFSGGLGREGVQIISGLALGIDSHAHEGCLKGGGKTFAVLGCGADICYPASNVHLYNKIIESGGGIISEFAPGSPALSYHFPLRNRIISALSDMVIVVEARKKSGSLITAGYALEQGKNLFAVPGRNNDPLSFGCNDLISKGAGTALSCPQLLAELGLESQKNGEHYAPRKNMTVSPTAGKLLSCLSSDPYGIDEIAVRSGLSLSECFRYLLELELSGLASKTASGLYIRTYR